MLRLLVLFFVVSSGAPVFANNSDSLNSSNFSQASHSSRGGIGLINTPTARFSDDGEFGLGLSMEAPYNRMFAKMQFFPWLEAVLKYTKGYNQPYIAWSDSEAWTDKGIDIKFRLTEETKFVPELAVGLLDFGGTGAYSAEFIVASKRFNNIDLSLGLGYGTLAAVDHISNPLGWFNDMLSKINIGSGEANLQHGGSISFGTFFEGDKASIFGGIEYFTPVPDLSIKLEYDTNLYPVGTKVDFFDPNSRNMRINSRLSAALNYRLHPTERDNIDLSLGYVHGNTLYASVAIHSNLNFSGKSNIYMIAEELDQPYLEPYSTLNPEWKKYLSDTILWQMANAGFVTHQLVFNGNELIAEVSQNRFRKTIRAIDLASRILANNSPTNIDKITVVNIDLGIETLRATIPRETLVNSVLGGALPEELLEFSTDDSLDPGAFVVDNEDLYPHFSWSIQPALAGTLQHPEKFYFWQLQAMASAQVDFKKGLYLTSQYVVNIYNNYDKGYNYHWPDGQLHHVRQNRRIYIREGEKKGLRKLALDYLVDLHPNVKSKISVGYLEMMFGGIGGEVIYMPDHKQWALGFDAYWLKQRDFDQKFGFQDYEVVTSLLSYYYDLPFYDMRFKISAGRFLGKDVGAHLDFSRRFDTGARVGAIIAITNCDPDCVGEGSFNKWIYFELPMDLWIAKSSTRKKSNYAWTPLTKDAAQKVEAGELYGVMVDAKDEVDSLRKNPWSVKKILSGFSTTPQQRI
jgi:hypothetical protein